MLKFWESQQISLNLGELPTRADKSRVEKKRKTHDRMKITEKCVRRVGEEKWTAKKRAATRALTQVSIRHAIQIVQSLDPWKKLSTGSARAG